MRDKVEHVFNDQFCMASHSSLCEHNNFARRLSQIFQPGLSCFSC